MDNRIRVFYETEFGGAWQVWMDLDADFTGLCIGAGDTREDAIAVAEKELLDALQELRKGDEPKV